MHFVQDPDHWLRRLSPREWISAASGELAQAERAFASRDGRGGLAGAKRAAGMALNGVLRIVPLEAHRRAISSHDLHRRPTGFDPAPPSPPAGLRAAQAQTRRHCQPG